MKNLYITLFLLHTCILLQAQYADTKKETFFERVNKLSTREVILLGDKYQKEADTAIALYSISNNRYRDDMKEEEKQLCINSLLKTGDIYYRLGNYTNAFDHYIRALKIGELCADKKALPEIYLKLGSVCCTFLDYETGIGFYEKAYNICKTHPNKKLEYSLLSNLAGAYNYLNNIPEAKKYYYLSKQLTQPGDTLKNFMNLLNWGLILVNQKEYTRAVDVFHQSARFAGKYRMDSRYECSSYEELYKVYQLMGNNDSTLYYLKQCERLARQNGSPNVLIHIFRTYSAVYEKLGNSPKTSYYKREFLSIADSIFNLREFNRVKHSQSIYEMEKTNKEITYLNFIKEKKDSQIKAQQKVLLGILIGFLVISGFLAVVYIQKRKLSQAYKNLYNLNREITMSGNQNKELYLQKDISSRYQTSNLTDTQRQALLDSINEIMKSTEEYCEEDFSLEKLAALVNSNNKYVSQVINETYQKNFNIYINEYRIQKARERLMNTARYGNYTIKAIAESVGYKSTTTFGNAFKSMTGITPSIFQKMAKEEENRKRKEWKSSDC